MESRLTSAPAVWSDEAANQATCWRRIERKAAARTRITRRSVTTAKLSWRSTAPKALTKPIAMKTRAHLTASLRIASGDGLKKPTMNSAISSPLAGIASPVRPAPRSPET